MALNLGHKRVIRASSDNFYENDFVGSLVARKYQATMPASKIPPVRSKTLNLNVYNKNPASGGIRTEVIKDHDQVDDLDPIREEDDIE